MEVKKIVTTAGILRYEVAVDSDAKVIYRQPAHEYPAIILGFRSAGRWYYQGMHWNCRGGRPTYYRAMVTLYRFLRKNNVTDHSLRFLAWGKGRFKNGGYAIRAHSWISHRNNSDKPIRSSQG